MIKLISPLSITIIVLAVLLGLVVGGTGAIVTANADAQAADLAEQQALAVTATNAINADLEATKADLKTKEAARNDASRRYNAVGKKVDQMLSTVSTLQSQNSSLQSEYDSMPEAPSLIGINYMTAESLVESEGLTWSLVSAEGSCSDYMPSYNTDLIFRQYPSPGTKMKTGSWVTMYYLKDWYSTDLYRYDLCVGY